MNKLCPICGGKVPPKKRHGGLQPKYCSRHCRNVEYYRRRGGKEAQREYLDKCRALDGRPKIQCLICGKWYRQVGSHIFLTHGITAREYREAYGFDVKKGQLPEDYKELKREQALINQMDDQLIKAGVKSRFKKGQAGVGLYKRSQQTLERLKLNRANKWKPRKKKKSR